MAYKYEEIFETQTTLMYRPPEMCDIYLEYKIDQKVDVWMVGDKFIVYNLRLCVICIMFLCTSFC